MRITTRAEVINRMLTIRLMMAGNCSRTATVELRSDATSEIQAVNARWASVCTIVPRGVSDNLLETSEQLRNLFTLSLSRSLPGLVSPRPIENIPRQVEGFELRPDGIAVSINMATLPYTSWQLLEGKLILRGKSIGNGSSSNVTDSYTINSVGKPNMLVMDEKGREIIFDHKPLKEPLDQ